MAQHPPQCLLVNARPDGLGGEGVPAIVGRISIQADFLHQFFEIPLCEIGIGLVALVTVNQPLLSLGRSQ